jgi:hypothetical protein
MADLERILSRPVDYFKHFGQLSAEEENELEGMLP